MQTLKVALGERSYPIFIGEGLLEQGLMNPYIRGRQVMIVSNETVAPLYIEQLKASLDSAWKVDEVILPDGEQYKTLETFNSVMSYMLEGNYSRDVVVIALGGGVIGDLVGFAASCYQRGIDFIQIPTTLLSQVDSSVGGKTAVNHPMGKNMIGAFYQPQAVVIDIDTLFTLPAREFAAGMAEVIKYGILGDAEFFAYIEQHKTSIKEKNTAQLIEIIKRCCRNKADIVAQDEKESGIRALLNLGHTFGHAIEAEMGYGNWLHGEAVAVGMVQASQLAQLRGWLNESEVEQVTQLLGFFDLPVTGPENMDCSHYLPHMKKDKKVQADTIRFVLPKRIGKAILVKDVTESELQQIL